MKNIVAIVLALLAIGHANAQDKFFTKTGNVSFYSHSLVEDIKADNNQALCIVDAKTGEIVIKMLMRSFQFEKALMQEHFNENYVESEKYPKATFVGRIKNFETLNEIISETEVKGILKIHGKEKEIVETVRIKKSPQEVVLSGDFMVDVSDFNIKIPAVVSENIAKSIKISVDLYVKPYTK